MGATSPPPPNPSWGSWAQEQHHGNVGPTQARAVARRTAKEPRRVAFPSSGNFEQIPALATVARGYQKPRWLSCAETPEGNSAWLRPRGGQWPMMPNLFQGEEINTSSSHRAQQRRISMPGGLVGVWCILARCVPWWH